MQNQSAARCNKPIGSDANTELYRAVHVKQGVYTEHYGSLLRLDILFTVTHTLCD